MYRAALCVLLLTIPSIAGAQQVASPHDRAGSEPDETVDFDDRPFAIGAMLGLGTPVGLIGATLMYTPATPISFGAGAGSNLYGLQTAALVTLRPLSWERRRAAQAISITSAWSTGRWKTFTLDLGMGHDDPADDVIWASDRAHWFQIDVSYELVTRKGFWLRAGYGGAWMLNPGDAHCELEASEIRTSCEGRGVQGSPPESAQFTFTLVLGYAL